MLSTILCDVCFFELINGAKSIAQLVGITNSVVFAFGKLRYLLKRFCVELLLGVCLYATVQAPILCADGNGIDFDAELF